jgi:hypothetical protein
VADVRRGSPPATILHPKSSWHALKFVRHVGLTRANVRLTDILYLWFFRNSCVTARLHVLKETYSRGVKLRVFIVSFVTVTRGDSSSKWDLGMTWGNQLR